MELPAEDGERGQARVGDGVDMAAVAAVAARGPALGDEFLAPERNAPFPAVPALDVDAGRVEAAHLGREALLPGFGLTAFVVVTLVVVGAEAEGAELAAQSCFGAPAALLEFGLVDVDHLAVGPGLVGRGPRRVPVASKGRGWFLRRGGSRRCRRCRRRRRRETRIDDVTRRSQRRRSADLVGARPGRGVMLLVRRHRENGLHSRRRAAGGGRRGRGRRCAAVGGERG